MTLETSKFILNHSAPLLLRSLSMIASLIILGMILQGLNFGGLLETQWIDSAVRGKGIYGGLLFIGVASLSTAIGLPRQIISFLGGYAFGFLIGTGITLLATLFGAIIAFQYSRLMGRSFIQYHFPQHLKKIDNFLTTETITTVLILRFSPLTNNLITNLAAGISGIRFIPFIIGSTLGYLPQTLIFSLLGSGFTLDPEIRIGTSILLFLFSTLLGIWLWRRHNN